MAYLGAEPAPGQNREVDDISSGFNGSTTAFTLQVESQNVSPESANNILVSIAGVLKNPNTDYTINASTITFTSAPTSGQAFFGLILGAGVNTSTVSDGAITTAKIASDAVTYAKIQNVSATDRLLGRDSSGAGDIEEIAPSAVRTMLGLTTSATTDTTNASNISSGTLAAARVANLAASKITSGTFDAARIPDLAASKITSGTIATARLGSGTASSSTFLRGDSTFAAVTSTTINNNADNRVITGSGTANTLNGESTLTFDGTTLESTNSSFMIKGVDTNSNDSQCFIQFNSGKINLSADNNDATGSSGIEFTVDGSYLADFNANGFIPVTDNAIDLGSSSKRWQNVYTTDLKLSNEGKSNDVDGTWGNYTIQEGFEDLFLINHRTGKKFKFNLTEVA